MSSTQFSFLYKYSNSSTYPLFLVKLPYQKVLCSIRMQQAHFYLVKRMLCPAVIIIHFKEPYHWCWKIRLNERSCGLQLHRRCWKTEFNCGVNNVFVLNSVASRKSKRIYLTSEITKSECMKRIHVGSQHEKQINVCKKKKSFNPKKIVLCV